MLRKLILLTAITLHSILLFSQVKVQDVTNITSAVKSLEGPGVTISNITVKNRFVGSPAIGLFTDSQKSIGLGSGLLMTTGAARIAQGKNDSESSGQNNGDDSYDPDLLNLVKSFNDPNVKPGDKVLFDQCCIEFDIVTAKPILSFNYVFASEEFIEFPDFNDAFAFYISGPGILGKRNLAIVPGTNLPVSVTNIHPDYYRAKTNTFFPARNVQYYINNPLYTVNKTQYDGYTVPLTASIEITPCLKYHIKLVIQDYRDHIYDSGVFIEKGSFKSDNPPTLSIQYQYPIIPYGVEQCNNAKFIIKRDPSTPIDSALTYPIKVVGTATPDVDYPALPSTITIPAGQDSVVFDLEFFADGIKEPTENVTISIGNVCPSFPELASVSFSISDNLRYEIPSNDICFGDSTTLNPTPDPMTTIKWNSNVNLSCSDCASPIADPDTTAYFPFTITYNESGCSAYDSVKVNVLKLNPLINYHFEECYTKSDVFFDNNTQNANNYYWNFGDGEASEEKTPMHTYKSENETLPLTFEVTFIATSDRPSCKVETTQKVTITEKLFFPNLLTPNEDRKNDYFEVFGIGNECWTLTIFNRWGAAVYTKTNYNNNFDAKGIEDGLYYYQLENGPKNRLYKGWVQITR